MSDEPDVRELLAPMREREVDLGGAAFQVDRARVLARMTAATARQEPETRGWRRPVVLAAAAFVVLVVGARLWVRDQRVTPAPEIVVLEGHATHAHGELETAVHSKARVRTLDGVQLELQAETRLALGALEAGGAPSKLLAGAVRCAITHRSAARAFQIITPDVTVIDVGTVFTVSLDGPHHATRVVVDEGEVLVRHAGGETRVVAPGAWPPVVLAPVAPAPLAPALVAPPPPKRVDARSRRADAPAATLAQESLLLRRGLAAERQGRSSEAISSLTQLLTKYPSSPLAPDARAALARVRASTVR